MFILVVGLQRISLIKIFMLLVFINFFRAI